MAVLAAARLVLAGEDAPLGASSLPTNTPLRQIGPGQFVLGSVRLDKNARTVTLPAVVNQQAGLVEYLLVSSYGKIHESLLRTEAEPMQVQLALLLLGAKGAGTNGFPRRVEDPLPGEPVVIEVNLTPSDTNGFRRAESLIHNARTRTAMSRGDWVFNGSRVIEGQFIAQMDGSIIAVTLDEYALLNNPRAGRDDDEIWLANTNTVPAPESPVEVRIRLRQ